MSRKIYRSRTDRKLSGVCAGLAEYINADVTIIRLIWAIITFFTGIFVGFVIYIICAIIIPEEPEYYDADYKEKL